ncbi:MAG: PKD-like domain-containing protein, partial [Bacteroidota bacterium]|nr:PKD-like domain-containing protein [Bacteroidota bacterium]
CVGAVFSLIETVNPKPAVTNAATKTICTATGTAITLASSAPSNFAWTLGAITGGITGASASSGATISQTLTNPSNTADGTVPYIVTPTSTTGSCVGNASTITVTVTHAPTITNAATATICSGTATGITLTANQASTFAWTIGSNPGGITGASAGSGANMSQTLTNPSNATANTIQYIVTPTSTVGALCAGPAFTITVTVNPKPVVTTAATDATCSGTGPNIALTATAPSSFAWTIGTITGAITGASASSGAAINQALTNPSTTTAGTVQYLVTPTSTTGSCAGVAYTITVTVNPAPIAVFTGGANQTVCSGVALPVAIALGTSNSIAGTTFAWTRDNTSNVTGTTSGAGNISALVLTNTT